MNSQHGSNTITVEFVDLEKAQEDFQRLNGDRDAALWAMGDIAERLFRAVHSSEGMRKEFARQGVSLRGFARSMRLTPQRFEALRLTSSMFPAKDRLTELSWEHHHAVARELGHETQAVRRRWLRDAAKHDWNVTQLKRRMSARKPAMPTLSAEARVEKLRRQLAEAEARLALLRQDRTGGARS